MKNYNQSKTIEKAIDILSLFSMERREIGITEICNLNGLSKATAHRIVSTLLNKGFLDKNKITRKYCLGIKLLELASIKIKGIELLPIAQPIIDKLCEEEKLTVSIGVLNKSEVLIIAKAESNDPLRVTAAIGGHLPVYPTAIGKILLSSLSELELKEELTNDKIKTILKNKNTSIDSLLQILNQVKKEGIAIDNQEYLDGIVAIAAPILNKSGTVVAGIVASYPFFRRKSNNLVEIEILVRKAAKDISRQLGAHVLS